ncbi:MAG: hypothetical protein ABFQ89_02935, partial [Chloroflexota bacterium]
MDQFEQVQTKYAQLRRQLESNAVTNEQFLEQVADLMCQDADGNWWTVHPDSGVWHIHQDGSWKAAIPPAVVRTVPTPVAPPAAPSPGPRAPSQRWQEPAQRRQTPSWLIPVIAAVAAVAIIIAAFVFLLLPQIRNTLNRGQDQEAPVYEVTALPTVVEATNTPAAKDAPTQVPLGSDASQMKPTWTAVASEGFDVDLGNWDSAATNGTQEYSDSSLLLSTQQGNTLFVSLFGSAEYRDTWVQTTVSDLDGAGGIMVRGKVGDSGYLFGIDSQQQIYLGRLQGSHFAVVNWEPSDKVNAEGEDVLTVFSNGDEHRFFINGWQVGGFRDLTIKQG